MGSLRTTLHTSLKNHHRDQCTLLVQSILNIPCLQISLHFCILPGAWGEETGAHARPKRPSIPGEYRSTIMQPYPCTHMHNCGLRCAHVFGTCAHTLPGLLCAATGDHGAVHLGCVSEGSWVQPKRCLIMLQSKVASNHACSLQSQMATQLTPPPPQMYTPGYRFP